MRSNLSWWKQVAWYAVPTAVVLAACGREQIVASKYVKSVDVSSTGATIEVAATEELSLAGARLQVPANALNATTHVTLELGLESLSADAVGPAALWAPAGLRLASPATARLPVDVSASTTAAEVAIEAVDAFGAHTQLDVTTLENGYATFELRTLAAVQAVRRRTDGGVAMDGGSGGGHSDGGSPDGGAGGGSGDGGLSDAGSGNDGGVVVHDGGVPSDGGVTDGGVTDGGSGGGVDGGLPSDGGVRVDGGVPADGGVGSDGGTPGDAG